MEIQIFNPQLEFIGIIEKFDSFTFTTSLNDKGTFVLKVPFSIDTSAILKRNNIVLYKNLTGVIESVTADLSDVGTMTINGYEITYLLNKRIVWDAFKFDGNLEEFCRKIVNDNCINCASERVIPFLELGTENNIEQTITKEIGNENIFKTLKETCQLYDLGFRISFNSKEKKLIFNVFDGRLTDKVYNRDLDNIKNLSYVQSYSSYANVAKVVGQNTTGADVSVIIGSSQGFDRYEIYVDSSKQQEEGQSISEYQKILTQEGNEKLAEKYDINTFDAEVTSDEDVDVGDKVTVIDAQLGIKLDTFISKIEYIFDGQNETQNLTFGYDVPSIYKKVI